MVNTAKRPAPALDRLRKDEAGRWLCTVADGCDGPATLQVALPCVSGCDAAVDQHERIIADKRREADDHERALDIIRVEMQRAAEDGEPKQLSAVEQAAIRLGHDNLKQLRADIEKLEAVRGRVAEEHTHPVMACAKHEKNLAQIIAAAAAS